MLDYLVLNYLVLNHLALDYPVLDDMTRLFRVWFQHSNR
jgi:hypothetical protein